jgi:hypothetical protein
VLVIYSKFCLVRLVTLHEGKKQTGLYPEPDKSSNLLSLFLLAYVPYFIRKFRLYWIVSACLWNFLYRCHLMWVAVIKERRVFKLRMEEAASRSEGHLRIYLINSYGQPTWDIPPAWGLGEGLTYPRRKKKQLFMKCSSRPLNRTG